MVEGYYKKIGVGGGSGNPENRLGRVHLPGSQINRGSLFTSVRKRGLNCYDGGEVRMMGHFF